jgi:hypothetical protein
MMKILALVAEGGRIAGGSVIVSATTYFVSDQFMMDATVAVIGAFFAGSPGRTWNAKAWQLFMGVLAGLAASLIFRASELGEAQIRGLIFACAALSAKALFWLDTPAKFASDMTSFAKGIRALYSILPWSRR